MSVVPGIGSVVTFYSWKGGVGRTFALANTAVQLARAGRRVLMIDWDLEAPGLGQYFSPENEAASRLRVELAAQPGGLWSLLRAAREGSDGRLERAAWETVRTRITVPMGEPGPGQSYAPTPGDLDLIPSGHGGADYPEELARFSWQTFYQDSNGYAWLEEARRQWVQAYDFVLLDSRTGLTDAGGICTIQLPDTLVLVFSANDQSFGGGMKVVHAAQSARRSYGQERGQLTVIPLLSRWAGHDEVELGEQWMRRFDTDLKELMASWLPLGISPRRFLERVRVPQVARFSFGEPFPVLTHSTTDPSLPGLCFDLLSRLLLSNVDGAGKIIDAAYEPPKSELTSSASEDAKWSLLAGDMAALHRELGKIAQAHGRDSEAYARANRAAGVSLLERAKFADAELLLRRALSIDDARFGPDDPRVATDLNNLAQLVQATNRLAEAEPLMRRALAIEEAKFGSDDPRVAIRLSNLAQLLQDTNRLAEAEPMMRRALAIDEASYGPDHPRVATDLNNLAILLQATKRQAEAEPMMRRALAIDEASYGPDHPSVGIKLNNLAALLQATSRPAEAEPMMRRALAIDEASYGSDHPLVAIRLHNLALLLQDTGRMAEAEPMMRRALAIFMAFQRDTSHPHPHRDTTVKNYTALLARMGRDKAEITAALEGLAAETGVSLSLSAATEERPSE